MPPISQSQPSGYPRINARTSLDELMTALKATPAPTPPDTSRVAAESPAVAHCCQAYADALKAARLKGKTDFSSTADAAQAYRQAMPPLSGPENIRDFIACLAHAMLIDAIKGSDGARLLYAAQVAHTTLKVVTKPVRIRNKKKQDTPLKIEKKSLPLPGGSDS